MTSIVNPPPPAPPIEEEEEQPQLSFVELQSDNKTIYLNGERKYALTLPLDLSRKRLITKQWEAVESVILIGCNSFGVDSISSDNVIKLAREVVSTLIERRKAKKAAAQGEEQQAEQQQQPEPEPEPQEQPKIELTPELTRELTYEEIADILSTSIKKDNPNKLITFNSMLLAQTNKDQFNAGYQAESSAGKSYIAYELASYFPPNEVLKIASASPTAFYHKGGVWDEKRKAQVCDLEHKIVIFADQPHFQLLEKMRSVLSKDDKGLTYWITDKSRSGANRTKTIIIKGFASFFFCTAKTDPDEQEKTRMILLSPETDEEKLYASLELAALRNSDSDEYRKLIEQDPKRRWLIDRILAIRQSGIREIIIPDRGKPVFDRFINEHKHLIARHQRDLPRIFGFIKAHALMNCFNRERMTNGKLGTIIATQTDIDAGFALYKEIEESNELGLSPYIHQIYSKVIKPNLNSNGISRKEIRSKYFSVFHKFLHPKFEDSVVTQIEAAGLIQQEPDPQDKRKVLVLPSVKDDAEEEKEESKYIPHDSGYTPNRNNKDSDTVHTVSGDISSPPGADAIEETLRKVMIGEGGEKKGYFTKDDFIYTLVIRPKQEGWSECQADQTLQALVEEGKIIEFEPGKYKPTTEELNRREDS